ncbi:restriction endonuclease subunit S [Veillonella parvula]|uniref:restriction endonuclease subunit S n=1 Tax=Veillonella parvula TaxID=29466 RepID=UPI001D069799|nr:restriction endonuclease subunit S [Veillonella parvula]MDU4225372.1 restriction endonuclease subunit S [Streptococcus sp.]MCB6804814.1 restriction endonuclease subunit S [Veillonella parvula]MCQ4926126.1 restriction endonuclease subunit S [Veillonella parvula]MCQ4957316.1 restriction endonuclease subunit S [Veillonella parvula]MDU4429881.1 restriction endonuclease subunit S [Veillonella parvula]
MSKEKRRVPKLRFPGFTEDWEQCELEELCNVYDGTHQTPRYTNSGVMFVSVENIKTLESDKYISEEDFKSEFKIFPEYGDILLTRIGDVGSANIILDNIKRAYYVSLALLKPKDINSLFLLALLASSSVQSEIWRRTLHIAFPKKINKNEISKVIVNKPSIPEQEKIGELIYALDRTITLYQRKLDHLNMKKKALLQKLFPKNGERYPELRFPEFTEDWEQCKLGDVANIKTGSRNQQDSVTNGQFPFFIRSEKIEKLDTYDFNTEAILVPGDGRIGEIFHYYNGKFALHQRVYKVDNFKGVDAFYLLYLFHCRFKEHALRLNAQGTVPSLRLPMFTEWNICIPSLQEQICIGRVLNKFELMITLHQRKLEHLQLQKKALLQQLFV